jgi:hypothetical protein
VGVKKGVESAHRGAQAGVFDGGKDEVGVSRGQVKGFERG